jgi:hypothetical protein
MHSHKLFLFFAILLLSSSLTIAQIALPASFNCVISKDHYRENSFTDGNIMIKSDVYGREELFGIALVNHFKPLFPFAFNRTSDGLYVGTGSSKNLFFYIILIPEHATVAMLSAENNGEDFSNYSTFVLKMVRLQLKNKKDIYFTNAKGEPCME